MLNALVARLTDADTKQAAFIRQSKEASIAAARMDAQWHELLESFFAEHPNYLKELRGEKTQQQIAELAGVADSNISKLENGKLDKISKERLTSVLRVYTTMEHDDGTR